MFRLFCLVAVINLATFSAHALSPSTVGWFNTFVPGGGQMLLGNYTYGGVQGTVELATFVTGYKLSAKSPFTLDGVPESIPAPRKGIFGKGHVKSCGRRDARGICTQKSSGNGIGLYSGVVEQIDISSSIEADLLQEIGLKYHMVNVFESYRMAGATGQIDTSSIGSLFAAPFSAEAVGDTYVLLALLTSLGFHTYTFLHETVVPTAPLNARSNTGYGLMYGLGYPTGSAAPEEMFYRGFIQNELLNSTGTPYAAIPITAAAYMFSHSPDSFLSAGTSGLFLGYLAYRNKGQLKKNIAFHFWSDVIMGIHAILSLQKNERPSSGDLAASNLNVLNFKFEY